MSRIVSVNLATVRTDAWTGSMGRTGIDKRPADGPVHIGYGGVSGDTVCDRRHHGGLDRAVYAFAAEDYGWWRDRVPRPLPPGSFGENLTTEGVDINDARIGDRWAVGSALLEITAPRIACRVFAGFWDVPDLVRRFTERGRPGAYLRVVREGAVRAGDEVRVVARSRMLTVGEAFRAMTTDPSLLPRLARAAEHLPTDVRVKTDRRLARRSAPV